MNRAVFAVLILNATVLGACHDSGVSRAVGARCVRADECDERCLTDAHWPGGFCTVSCSTDSDCPDTAVCIGEAGGVCAFDCHADTDCRFLDDTYVCKTVDQQGGGKVDVCRGN